MHKLTIAAATIAFGALLASAPAKADSLNGAPEKNGNQCFTFSPGGSRDSRFGAWGACPQTASVAVAPASRHHGRRNHSASR
jgi:uncharacterized membrane protein